VSASSAVSQLPWMWLVSRASGLMLLVLFSTVFVLGISTRLGTRLRSMPRFAVAGLHRTLALFSVALLALHVATAVLDPYVSIGWWAAVLPFTAHYRPLALSLGTLAVDLGAAVLITSLVRRRLGHRWWRTVHWLAYASWPLAFMHSLSAGNDMGIWWVAAIVWGSGSAVALAVVDRILFIRQSRKQTIQRSNPAVRRAIGACPGVRS
jgi:sulfoxide reductase heme-binding subunit YedZ